MVNFLHIAKNAGTSIGKLVDDGSLKLDFHTHWEDPRKLSQNTMVILRDPFDRFASAYFYLLIYKQSRQYAGVISSPNALAEGLLDNKSEAILYTKRNQRVGEVNMNIDWTFIPQHVWYNDFRYVLFYENLEDDFKNFLSEIDHPHVDLPKVNSSNKKDFVWSDKSIHYIKSFYEKDFELIDRLKNG